MDKKKKARIQEFDKVDKEVNTKINLENWMAELPPHLTNIPLIHLAIPGSHNSFSFSITPQSKISPDSPKGLIDCAKHTARLTTPYICKWSKGQAADVTTQLNLGIRFFDIRLVLLNPDILICHGLYGGNIQIYLEEIKSFLVSHTKEIVILDFQHFYNFQDEQHQTVLNMLKNIFGRSLCHKARHLREYSLNVLWKSGSQVIVIYRNVISNSVNFVWPSRSWPTPWPQKTDTSALINFLNVGLQMRKTESGYVSQGILTPNVTYVIFHLFSSLRKTSYKVNKKVLKWVESNYNGPHGINVVICDFIENFQFTEKVIRCNYKSKYVTLLSEEDK